MKKKTIFITTVLTVLAIGTISVSHVYATGNDWSDVIYPRVYIEDIDVGGKHLHEVEELIKKNYSNPVLMKKIEVQVNDKIYTLDYSKIEAKYNIDEVIKEAFNYGKKENLLNKYKLIKGDGSKRFKLEFAYNSKPIDEFISRI